MKWEIHRRETWLYETNPSLKLIVLVVLFFAVLFMHNPNVLINFSLALFVLFCFATGYPANVLAWLFLPFFLIFVSTASSMMMFGEGTTTWFRWGLIHVTEESFWRGVHLGFRALALGLLGLIFSLTTRPVHLFYSLMQQLKLKPKYAYSFLAAVRLLPMMMEEFQTVHYALKVRGVPSRGGLSKVKRYAIPLLSQSIRRAQRIAVAMEAKQFSGSGPRTFYYEIGFSKYDVLFVVLFAMLAFASYYVGIHYPYLSINDVR
ncbi:ABC transporter permease [Geobacillus subterraneus]|uniref:ABC transporter permease n=2 Tax=Geobacillus TaxID=129337 RepID=A0ABM6ADW8_9BACL|nr:MULTISPECIES: energy-coupling factor transporter transmembrane component T [Geobacillus]AMX84488.1 ABC transporter permease [Geobacillus subterraneus]KZS24269.1 ABC transporter permease [Geobacillus subterraneus]OXB87529.1 ABC transporter permease [Geobacillus uzenensis]QIZ66752.1 energy-coupling factor transporter transmembrane protein EcfT [Geobacillus subterraneus]WPZ18975.1 energy-coupling factor transporter transmembrane component T [Geobacillus subterraneus]